MAPTNQKKNSSTTSSSKKASAKKKDKEKKESSQLRIKLRSYDSKLIDKSCRQIIDVAERSEVETVGPVPLPTEFHTYTVNRSTFVHSKSKDQFEVRVHKRLIEVNSFNQNFVDAIRDLTLPTGVEIEIKAI